MARRYGASVLRPADDSGQLKILVSQTRPPRVPLDVVIEVRKAVRHYEAELFGREADLTLKTKESYIKNARRFVRWLAGEYEVPSSRSH